MERSQRAMIKRVDKVHDRVVEAEARDATQEREMKDGLEKLLKSVQVRIQNFENDQDKKRAEQEVRLNEKLDRIEQLLSGERVGSVSTEEKDMKGNIEEHQ